MGMRMGLHQYLSGCKMHVQVFVFFIEVQVTMFVDDQLFTFKELVRIMVDAELKSLHPLAASHFDRLNVSGEKFTLSSEACRRDELTLSGVEGKDTAAKGCTAPETSS